MKKVVIGLCVLGVMCTFAPLANAGWVDDSTPAPYVYNDSLNLAPQPARILNNDGMFYYNSSRRNLIRNERTPEHKKLPVKGKQKFMC
jgi:hypothetical protein